MFVILLLPGLVPAQAMAGVPSHAEIVQANDDNIAAVRACVVTFRTREGTLVRSGATSQPVSGKSTSLDAQVCNRSVTTEQMLTWDRLAGIYRLEVKDTRNLQAVLSDEGFSPQLAYAISRSAVTIVGRGYMMSRRESARGQTVHLDRLTGREDDPCRIFGSVRPSLLQDQRVRLRVIEHGSIHLVKDAAGSDVITLDLDAAANYRYVRLYRVVDGRPRAEWIASEYREAKGVPLPFHLEERQWNTEGALSRERVLDVSSIALNEPIEDARFGLTVPAGSMLVNAVLESVGTVSEDLVLPINALEKLGLVPRVQAAASGD